MESEGRGLIKLTQSLEEYLIRFHPDTPPLIMLGHIELFTDEMQAEYLGWLKTPEGRSYLKGGSNYKDEEDE